MALRDRITLLWIEGDIKLDSLWVQITRKSLFKIFVGTKAHCVRPICYPKKIVWVGQNFQQRFFSLISSDWISNQRTKNLEWSSWSCLFIGWMYPKNHFPSEFLRSVNHRYLWKNCLPQSFFAEFYVRKVFPTFARLLQIYLKWEFQTIL